jgi:carbon monoxide dehydrogenase subunit G
VAETEYSTTAKLSIETIWDFVKEMDNWAPLLTGYQSHEKENEDDSLWVLKGDVGVMSRTLKFKVHVSEWAGPERVTFELKGLNEQMEGGGVFLMEPFEGADASSSPEAAANAAPEAKPGLWARIVRALYQLIYGKVERAESGDGGPGDGMAKLTFRLRLDPEGPMAPMVNAMMKTAMPPAAEDLANKIMAHLEEREAGEA